MASCECCWAARLFRVDMSYEKAIADHENWKCICAKITVEGRRARAGQFWDEESQRDRRDDAKS